MFKFFNGFYCFRKFLEIEDVRVVGGCFFCIGRFYKFYFIGYILVFLGTVILLLRFVYSWWLIFRRGFFVVFWLFLFIKV